MSELRSASKDVEYVRKEMATFRGMMGYKKYWEFVDETKFLRKIDLAFRGLFHIYVRCENLTDQDKVLMEAIIVEFARRDFYMAFKPREVRERDKVRARQEEEDEI